MKKSRFLSSLAMVLTLATAIVTSIAKSGDLFAAAVKQITVQDAAKLIETSANSKGLVLLDVRTSEEYAEDHISGAKQLDFYAKDFKDQLAKLDRSKQYLVYCRSGGRSAKAAAMMLDLGFPQVSEIGGGMIAWEKAKLPVVSGQ